MAASVRDVEDAARSAQLALAAVVTLMERARRELEQGASLAEIQKTPMAREALQVRRNADDAIRRYQHAVMTYRAQFVRGLVDEQGLTITAASRKMGVSRQMTARMYDLARDHRDS
jgi:predicted DNA-binding protein (UPF0251 family)